MKRAGFLLPGEEGGGLGKEVRNTGRQVQEWAHKRSAKGEEEAVQSLDGEEAQGQPRRPAALCSRLMAAWMGGCAGRAGVQALLPRGAKSSHGSEESKIWAGEKKKSQSNLSATMQDGGT